MAATTKEKLRFHYCLPNVWVLETGRGQVRSEWPVRSKGYDGKLLRLRHCKPVLPVCAKNAAIVSNANTYLRKI